MKRPLSLQFCECPEKLQLGKRLDSEIRDMKLAVILSERGPERLSVRRGPRRQVFVCGVEVGGGESKNLRLFFNGIRLVTR
jgi:hypothetical protein